MFNILVVVIVS